MPGNVGRPPPKVGIVNKDRSTLS